MSEDTALVFPEKMFYIGPNQSTRITLFIIHIFKIVLSIPVFFHESALPQVMPAQQVLKRGGSVLGNQNDQTKHERFGYAASPRRV